MADPFAGVPSLLEALRHAITTAEKAIEKLAQCTGTVQTPLRGVVFHSVAHDTTHGAHFGGTAAPTLSTSHAALPPTISIENSGIDCKIAAPPLQNKKRGARKKLGGKCSARFDRLGRRLASQPVAPTKN